MMTALDLTMPRCNVKSAHCSSTTFSNFVFVSLYSASCATDLYVMAFTSSDDHSGSDDLPILKVYLTDGQVAEVDFPNYNGVDEQAKHKGDFWRFTTANLGLTGVCLTKDLISSIVVVSGGKDTWKIGSVVTILRSAHEYTVVTGDIDVETVIDSNQSQAGSLTAITLTKTYD